MLVCCERYVWKISQNYTFLFATWWQNPEWARISKLFECFGQRWYTTAGRSCRLTRSFQSYEVCKKLFSIKPSKAHGPDNIPCRVLNEFAYELAAPIATIFNVSLTNGIVPGMWKDWLMLANITPIPKIKLTTSEGDRRPMSLTPCLSYKGIRRFRCVLDDRWC